MREIESETNKNEEKVWEGVKEGDEREEVKDTEGSFHKLEKNDFPSFQNNNKSFIKIFPGPER